MLIRIAIEDDLNALTPLFDQYRQSLGQAPGFAESFDFLQSRLHENDSVIFIALEQQALVGFIQLYPSFSSRLLKPLWYFDDLYVVESHRHKGIATRLVVKAKELADETNVMAVRRQQLDGDGFLPVDHQKMASLLVKETLTLS